MTYDDDSDDDKAAPTWASKANTPTKTQPTLNLNLTLRSKFSTPGSPTAGQKSTSVTTSPRFYYTPKS